MRVALLTLAILWAFRFDAQATSIVAVWTPAKTVLGADSLTHTLDNSKYWSICKIGIANKVYWSASGLTANAAVNYNLEDIVNKAMSGDGSFDARMAAFETSLSSSLGDLGHALIEDDPSWFSKYAQGIAIVRIIFDEFAGGVNHLHVREFVTRASGLADEVDVTVHGADCPGPYCETFRVYVLGQTEFANKIANDSQTWTQADPALGVRRAIEAEIAHEGEHVGPPISILEITKDGPHWVDKGMCGGDGK
jgi:hypothetical protein